MDEASRPSYRAIEAELDAAAAQVHAEVLRRLAGLGSRLEPQADAQCFAIGELHIAVTLHREVDTIGLYADIGPVAGPQAARVWRHALERNLELDCRPVRFGLHPDTERLVGRVLLPVWELLAQPGLLDDAIEAMRWRLAEMRAFVRDHAA